MKRLFLRSVGALFALAGLSVGVCSLVCWHYGVWTWRDWKIYKCMEQEIHPVWRDLHAGRIKPGDNVDSLIWRTNPVRVEKFENVTMLNYHSPGFSAMTIIAKDGHLMSAAAASCTWEKTFFDVWDKEELTAFNARYYAHREKEAQARQRTELILECALAALSIFPT